VAKLKLAHSSTCLARLLAFKTLLSALNDNALRTNLQVMAAAALGLGFVLRAISL
jgi:hypothetical protein